MHAFLGICAIIVNERLKKITLYRIWFLIYPHRKFPDEFD